MKIILLPVLLLALLLTASEPAEAQFFPVVTREIDAQCIDGRCPLIPNKDAASYSFNGVCIGNATGKNGKPGCWVLTVSHGFDNATDPRVFAMGQWRKAELIRRDKQRDLALLWVSGVPCDAIPVAAQDPPNGSIVHLMVFDHLAGGRFRKLQRRINTRQRSHIHNIWRWSLIGGSKQGYSGGAVIYNGEVIGILAFGSPTEGVAVQRDSIRKFLIASDENSSLIQSQESEPQPKVDLLITDENSKLQDEIDQKKQQLDRLNKSSEMQNLDRKDDLSPSDSNASSSRHDAGDPGHDAPPATPAREPLGKIKDLAFWGGKTYLKMKYGGAIAVAVGATGWLGWWFGKRTDKSLKGGDLSSPVVVTDSVYSEVKCEAKKPCGKCKELESEYEELQAVTSRLQKELANSTETVIELDSFRDSEAWRKAAHGMIKLHPTSSEVMRMVSQLRELQKQYLSGAN